MWLGAPVAVVFTLFITVIFVPVVYSLVLYKQYEREGRA